MNLRTVALHTLGLLTTLTLSAAAAANPPLTVKAKRLPAPQGSPATVTILCPAKMRIETKATSPSGKVWTSNPLDVSFSKTLKGATFVGNTGTYWALLGCTYPGPTLGMGTFFIMAPHGYKHCQVVDAGKFLCSKEPFEGPR